MLTLFSLISLASAETDCSTRIPNSMFAKKLDSIETSLKNRDLPQMTQKMEQTTESIPCLAQPLTPTLASKYHRLAGIYHFINKDQDLAGVYFISARTAMDESEISKDVFPEGHILHSLYAEADPISDTDPIEPPFKGDLIFDGVSQSARPLFRPTIFQHVAGGKALESVLISSDDQPLPAYETEASAPTAEAPPPAEKSAVPTPKEAAEEVVKKENLTPTAPSVTAEKKFPVYLASGGTLLASGAILLLTNQDTRNYLTVQSYAPEDKDFNEDDKENLSTICNFYGVDVLDDGKIDPCVEEINAAATRMGVMSGGLMLLGTAGIAVHFVF